VTDGWGGERARAERAAWVGVGMGDARVAAGAAQSGAA